MKQDVALSRRQILTGAAALGAASLMSSTAFAAWRKGPLQGPAQNPGTAPNRTQHTATDLGNGCVLIAGGLCQGRPTHDAFVVDVANGSWWPLPPMNQARTRHAAVALPDGRVLVMGGMGRSATNTVEAFDPSTLLWTAQVPMDSARADFTANFADGRILLFGGVTSIGFANQSQYSIHTISQTP